MVKSAYYFCNVTSSFLIPVVMMGCHGWPVVCFLLNELEACRRNDNVDVACLRLQAESAILTAFDLVRI
jgi:hypothetical protein